MPVDWSLLPQSELCIVTGRGTITRSDIEAYVNGTTRAGAEGYAKVVDVTGCTLALDHDDLECVSLHLVQTDQGERLGPMAIIVDAALNLDVAVLVKQRVGRRPFRIFTSRSDARDWLESYRDSRPQFLRAS